MNRDQLQALESKATPRPWHPCLGPDYDHLCTALASESKPEQEGNGICDFQPHKFDTMNYTKADRDWQADQDFTMAIRNLAPELIELWKAAMILQGAFDACVATYDETGEPTFCTPPAADLVAAANEDLQGILKNLNETAAKMNDRGEMSLG